MYNKGMNERDSRTALLLGEAGVRKLKESRVAVFGLGGVGSYCAEALARAGVGRLALVDKDAVEESNINRQLVALYSTLGRDKVSVMGAHVADISPFCEVEELRTFYLPETAEQIDLSRFDWIADCIDNVTAKLCLIERAKAAGVPVISAMGAGNKLDPSLVRIADISQTKVCPLARVVRRELKKRGIEGVPVAYSEEAPAGRTADTVGSVSFVPSVMGLMMAGYIVREIVK